MGGATPLRPRKSRTLLWKTWPSLACCGWSAERCGASALDPRRSATPTSNFWVRATTVVSEASEHRSTNCGRSDGRLSERPSENAEKDYMILDGAAVLHTYIHGICARVF